MLPAPLPKHLHGSEPSQPQPDILAPQPTLDALSTHRFNIIISLLAIGAIRCEMCRLKALAQALPEPASKDY